ncbi:glycosyltransferase family 4 protein [Calditrichota bacterium]
MKILFISDVRSSHLKRWAKYFASHDHEIVILSTAPGNTQYGKVIYVNPGEFKVGKFLRNFQHAYFLLREWLLIRFGGFDIVHVHFLRADASALVASYHPRCIISFWGSDARSPMEGGARNWVKVRQRALSQSAAVTVVHPSLEFRVRKWANLDTQFEVIPFGADISRFGKIVWKHGDEQRLNFTFIKPLVHNFGADLAIIAFSKVVTKFPNANITFIGRGDSNYVKELQNLVSVFGISRNVNFAGKVSDTDLEDYLAETDVLVQPSRWDAFGVAIMEAMVVGVPVIATRVGGIKDIVLDGITGLTVESEDVNGLSAAMRKLASDVNFRNRLGVNARKYVTELLSFDMHAERMEELYLNLIED